MFRNRACSCIFTVFGDFLLSASPPPATWGLDGGPECQNDQNDVQNDPRDTQIRPRTRLKAASFVLALNKAHVLALSTAHVLRLNKADVLALIWLMSCISAISVYIERVREEEII